MQQLDQISINLLRAITIPRFEASSRTIAEAAKSVQQWDHLIEAARRHGILPMIYRRLVQISDCVPPGALQQMKSEFERNAFHAMTNAEELLQVLDAFPQ